MPSEEHVGDYQPTEEDIANHQQRLQNNRDNLEFFLEQLVLQGGPARAEPVVKHGIRSSRFQIARIKEVLRGWGVVVQDHPDDEEPAPPRPPDGNGRPPPKTPHPLLVWTLVGLLLLMVGGGSVFTLRSYFFPPATPDPRKAVILVADFLGPETADGKDNRGVTRVVLETLRNKLGDEDDTSVVALGEPITAQEGSDAARAAGEQEGASIVIWGWYEESGTDAILSTHFEILQTPRHMPELEAAGAGGMLQKASLADLESFTLHTKLSGQLTYFTLVTMGMAHYSTQDWDRAVALLSDALTAAAELAAAGEAVEAQGEVFFSRGNAYLFKGEVDRAIADYDRAIELKPDLAEAYNNRGNAYWNKGEVDRAIADYDRAIELKPDYAEAYYNRGIAYRNKGEVDRAIADYDRAIELKPDYAEAYNNRGIAYWNKGEVDRAIADYDRAIELKPDDAEAYYNRGIAYKMQGNTDQARADFEKSLELSDDPDLQQAVEGWLREMEE